MIDIQKAKKVVNEYMSNYDITNERIKTKVQHIHRVAELGKKIAEGLNLDKEDVELAELIGLLHDIGRFEQVRLYNTFTDRNSVNHGELGAKILFEDRLIDKIIDDRKYDEIIKVAIINHNRNPKNVKTSNERELLHSKIVRDADKTDILYILTFGEKRIAWDKDDLSNEIVSDEIYNEFIKSREIDYNKIGTPADILICNFAYIFDYNFRNSLDIVEENNYIDKIYNRFKFNNEQTRNRIDKIYKLTKEYMKNFKN